MKLKIRSVQVFIIFVCLSIRSIAGTFTVISNADSGPGSLRDIIQLAAANGTTSYDTILFNLPGSTVLDKTITINGSMPLSGKLVIDGTSQPGSAFGVTDARVIIKRGAFMCAGLTMTSISDVEIYGIWFKNFDYVFSLNECHQHAILMNEITRVTIGKLNKGNAFTNHHTTSIRHKSYFNNIFQPTAFAETVNIEYNIFGLNEAGTAIDPTMLEGMDIANGRNVTITHNKGNCYAAVSSTTEEGNGFVKFTDNNFANPIDPNQYGFGSFAVTKQGLTSTYVNYDLEIYNNKITNNNQYCIILWDMHGKIDIHDNDLGAYHDMKNQTSYGLAMIRCVTTSSIRVYNNIIQNRQLGIRTGSCGRVSINNNSIFCNTKGIYIQSLLAIPSVSITNITATNLSGSTIPGGKVELFFTDTCTSLCENGKLSLGTTIANGTGAFSFAISGSGLYTATVTTTDSITSEFNGVKADTTHAVVKNATCGNSNGSITGITIINASSWYWENDLGQIISTTDTNLYNLPAGRYRLVLHESNVACSLITGFYEVLQVQPVLSGNPFTITHPGCGQANGKVVFTGTRPPLCANQWLNNSGNIIQQNGDSITNLSPGQYYFKLYALEEPTCYNTYGPFVLVNQAGPTLDVSNVQLTNTTCGNANGSITGITASNVTGTPFIQWLNAQNIPVGASMNLLNVPAGNYKLKFKDQSNCDTITTGIYTILDNGKVTIDATSINIHPAGCSVNNGSIDNITTTGATAYQWQNLTGGTPAGNTLSIYNLAAGNYQLTASNSLGCSEVSPVITVPLATFSQIDVTAAQFNNATCGQNNGSIHIQTFSKDPSLYSFRWIDSASNQVIGTGVTVSNLGQGTYILIATDTNGCEKDIYKKGLLLFPKPALDISARVVVNDMCSQQLGSITGIAVTGLLGPTTYSWINQLNTIVGNSMQLTNVGASQYKLIINDANGCFVETEWIGITNADQILTAPLYADRSVNYNSTVQLTVRNFQPGTYILFKDPAGLQEIQRNTSGTFVTGNLKKDTSFYVKRIVGSCTSPLTTIHIKINKALVIYVPNAFTPNGDGKNDILKAVTYGPVKFIHFTIYNRYGEIVFTSTDINFGWNGTYNGKRSDQGTYSWVLKAIDESKNYVIEDRGTFILVR